MLHHRHLTSEIAGQVRAFKYGGYKILFRFSSINVEKLFGRSRTQGHWWDFPLRLSLVSTVKINVLQAVNIVYFLLISRKHLVFIYYLKVHCLHL